MLCNRKTSSRKNTTEICIFRKVHSKNILFLNPVKNTRPQSLPINYMTQRSSSKCSKLVFNSILSIPALIVIILGNHWQYTISSSIQFAVPYVLIDVSFLSWLIYLSTKHYIFLVKTFCKNSLSIHLAKYSKNILWCIFNCSSLEGNLQKVRFKCLV